MVVYLQCCGVRPSVQFNRVRILYSLWRGRHRVERETYISEDYNMASAIRVTVTGAAGQVAYAMLGRLASGKVFAANIAGTPTASIAANANRGPRDIRADNGNLCSGEDGDRLSSSSAPAHGRFNDHAATRTNWGTPPRPAGWSSPAIGPICVLLPPSRAPDTPITSRTTSRTATQPLRRPRSPAGSRSAR